MSNFDLTALVHEVAAELDTTDANALAAAVLARIPRKHLHDALAQCLPGVVYDIARRPAAAAPDTGARPSRSSKVTGIREAWRRHLEKWVAVGDGNKTLGDCTPLDLEHAAKVRRELAEDNRRAAADLDTLRELLDEHQVATVRELPEGVLRDHFDGKAAA